MYQDYEIPKNLLFKTQDIIRMHGLKCSLLLNAQDFKEELTLVKATLKLSFSVLSKEILVQGQIKGTRKANCSRCLKEFEKSFEEEFSQLFPHKAEIIDIMYITRQTLALEQNIQELCSPDCKGLCAYCGCNKNEVECSCTPPKLNQFACLKDKFQKKK